MRRNKKGDGTFWIIMEIALVIFILIIIFIILKKYTNIFDSGLSSCTKNGGQCLSSCGEYTPMHQGDSECEKNNQNLVCCEKPAPEGGTEGPDARGYGANTNQLSVLLDNQKTSIVWGETRELDVRSTPYEINPVIDYGTLEELGKYRSEGGTDPVCSFFIEDTNTNKEYVLKTSAQDQTVAPELFDPKETFNVPGSFIVKCSDGDKLRSRYFLATNAMAGKNYALRIIVYDLEIAQRIKDNAFMDVAVPTQYRSDFEKMITDKSHWLVEFTSYFRIKPILEIRDIAGTWVNYDDITVQVVNPNYKLSSVEVAIVPGDGTMIKGDSSKSLSEYLYEACSNTEIAHYYSMLQKIQKEKVGTPGFNLGLFSLGRDTYQTRIYEASAPLPITISSGQKATIHIDAATIGNTFKINEMKVERVLTENNPLREQYLCVRARVSGSDGKTELITVVNQQPLRIDVAPPLIDNSAEYMEVVYPDPKSYQQTVTQLIAENRINPGQTLTPIYFERYPTLNIKKCTDKSLCQNYDYYFAPTHLQINVNTGGDLETGIVATLLGAALNELYQELVTTKPLETLCPLPNSGSYRTNSASSIRFGRTQGQGVYCLKISDAAGNYWMTWKEVYNPYDVLEELTLGLL